MHLKQFPKIGKDTGRLRNKSTSGDHPKYIIVEIDQNTEKSPGDLRRLATCCHSNASERSPANAGAKIQKIPR